MIGLAIQHVSTCLTNLGLFIRPDLTDVYSGNIPGTNQYMKNTFHEFKATTLYNDHIEHETPALFHTGSLAEYHDYKLRFLLYKYVKALFNVNKGYAESILNDDSVFQEAVQMYKHVVTHYLASKMELWMILFMHPVFGVTGGNLTYEFAKSRGMIHYHSILRSKHPALTVCNDALCDLAISISNAVDTLHEFINSKYTPSERWPNNPAEVFHLPGDKNIDFRKSFCYHDDSGTGGKDAWKVYEEEVALATEVCRNTVGPALLTNFGFHAMHTGHGPKEWVMPGGLGTVASDYRQTSDEMIKTSDVLAKKALKKRKWQQETHLYDHHVNIKNHVRTHRCS